MAITPYYMNEKAHIGGLCFYCLKIKTIGQKIQGVRVVDVLNINDSDPLNLFGVDEELQNLFDWL